MMTANAKQSENRDNAHDEALAIAVTATTASFELCDSVEALDEPRVPSMLQKYANESDTPRWASTS